VGNTRNSVPILGDIPLIGLLFSSINESVTITETIVLITPRVIKNLSDPMFTKDKNKVDSMENVLHDSGMAVERRLDQGPQMPALNMDTMDPGPEPELEMYGPSPESAGP